MKTATNVVHPKVPRPKVAATKVAGFTAEGVFVKLSVPEGMDAALQGLTREVLRHQPPDIYRFAAQYFENLIRVRGGGHVEEFTAWQETRTSKRSSRVESTTLVSTTQQDVSGIATLAATTGTVAVLATASASQPSAPAWDGAARVEERVSKSSSHSSASHVVAHSEMFHSVQMEHTGSPENSPREGDKPGGSSKKSKKRHDKKDKTRKYQESKSTFSSQEVESDSSKSAKTGSLSPKGVITKQVDTVVKGFAHDTVLTAEEISKKVAEKSSAINKEVERTAKAREELESEPNEISRQKRTTRKLKRQTKSVDSASFSDKSENGDTKLRETAESAVGSATTTEKNDKSVVESHSETENRHDHTLSTTAKEIVELQQLQEWVDGIQHSDHTKTSGHDSASEHTEKGKSQGDGLSAVPPESDFTNYKTAYMITNEVIGENPSDIKSEELRVLSEGSVRKSSAHDIREETGEDGSHLTTEEKAEETKEEKHEATEKTVLERKSNVQVDENGDTVEEEITITRTEQSSKTETTVSKSWTMETTIETLADGETRVIERMILHSPPLNEGEKDEVGVVVEGGKQTLLNHQENVPDEYGDISTQEMQAIEEEMPETAKESTEIKTVNVDRDEPSENDAVLDDTHQKITVTTGAVSNTGANSTENKREFGLIEEKEANKSIEQISVALQIAEKSINVLQQDSVLQDAHESRTAAITTEGDTVKRSDLLTPDASAPADEDGKEESKEVSAPVDEDGNEITMEEFGLIDAQEAKKSLEQISAALIRAEESIDALQAKEKPEVRSDAESASLESTREEVNEDGQVERKTEFGFIDPKEAKKSLDEIAVALSKAEDSLNTLQSDEGTVQEKHALFVEESVERDTADVHHQISSENHSLQKVATKSNTKSMLTEVDEDGKEIIQMSSPVVDTVIETISTDDSPLGTKEGGHGDQSSATLHTTVIENIDIKTEDIMIPLHDIDAEKALEVSKEGSKEETSSEPKGLSSQAPDFPTDEDQSTPRDEVESLRVDTPEDSSATKSSSGSDENGDPINPPTVVISRTADVVELKDGEVNIVTQMEKEGLVEGISNEEPMERIITKGVLQTLAEENMDHQSNNNITAKVAGITVVAATVGFITVEKGDTAVKVDEAHLRRNESTDENDTVEILAGDFDSNQFIHEESKHTSWLLQNPPILTSGSGLGAHQEAEAVEATGAHEVGNVKIKNHGTAVNSSEHKIEHIAELPEDKETNSHVEEASVIKRTIEHQQSGVSTIGESRNIDKSLRSMSPELDENGKPVPVDENGKPMYSVRKKRSLQTKRSVSLANDIIPDNSHVKLSRAGSLVGAHESTEHWYGSQIPATGSTLIKPVLAMARDPAIAALKPCNEPECVAVDVRDAKEDVMHPTETTRPEGPVINEGFDVMREMSLVTSRIGQSILSLRSEKSEEVDEGEGHDEPKHGRSDSQESFIISEDAVYIPLNPPGMKHPSLERIDSVPSILESPHDPTPPIEKEVFTVGLNSSFEEVRTHNVPEVVQVVTDAAVTMSPATYTVTEPRSDPGRVDNDSRDDISEENQEDDVLIVEYPTDAIGKVTKWDNVVVTSPADIKDAHKDEAVHQFESIPMEGQSHISMDDSLQEVPSLQDEAVGHVDSESELLDSMPEDDMERKWTDDISIVAGKAKGMIKGIFSQSSDPQNRSIGNEIKASAVDHLSEAATGHTRSLVNEAIDSGKQVKSVSSVVHDIEHGAEVPVHRASKTAANVLKLSEEEDAQGSVKASLSSLKENVASAANSLVSEIKHDVSAGANAASKGADDIEDNIKSASKKAGDKIEDAVKEVKTTTETAVDIVNSKAASVSDAVSQSLTAAVENVKSAGGEAGDKIGDVVEGVKTTTEKAGDIVSNKAASVSDAVSHSLTATVENVKSAGEKAGDKIGDAVEGVKTTTERAGDIVSNKAASVSDAVSQSLTATVENVKSAGEKAGDKIGDAVEGVKTTTERAGDIVSNKAASVSDAVSQSLTTTVENVKSAGEKAGDKIGDAFEGVKNTTGTAVDIVCNKAASVSDAVSQSLTATVENVKSARGKAGDKIENAVEGVKTTTKTAVDIVSAKAAAVSDAVSQSFADAVKNAESSSERVSSEIHTAVSDVKEKGKEVADDFADGIKSGMTSVQQSGAELKHSVETRATVGGENIASTAHSLTENLAHQVKDLHGSISGSIASVGKTGENIVENVVGKIDEVADDVVTDVNEIEKTSSRNFLGISSNLEESANAISTGVVDAAASVKDKANGVSNKVVEETSSLATKTGNVVDAVKNEVVIAKENADVLAQDFVGEVTAVGASVKDSVEETVENVTDGLASAVDSLGKAASKTTSSINEEVSETVHDVEEAVPSAKENLVSVAKSVSDMVSEGVKPTEQDIENAKENVKVFYDDVSEGVNNISSDFQGTVESAAESAQTAVGRVKRSAENNGEKLLHTVDKQADAIISEVSTQIKDSGSMAHRVKAEVDDAVRSAVESAHREETELQETLSSIKHGVQENTRALVRAAQDETVATLELAEVSVQQALSQAEKTITAEATKTHNIFSATDSSKHEVRANTGVTETERAVLSGQNSRSPGEATTGSESNGATEDKTVEVLERAEESVRSALNRAEETISVEAQKSLKFLTGAENLSHEVNTEMTTSNQVHEHEIAVESVLSSAHDTTVTTLEEAEESVKKALNRAEETISAEAQKSLKSLTEAENLAHEAESEKKKGSLSDSEETHNRSVLSTAEDVTVTTLDQAEQSVKNALNKAEETISAEAQKSLNFFTEAGSLTHGSENGKKNESPFDDQEIHQSVLQTAEDVTVTTLEQAEKSVRMALDKAEETISSEAKKSSLSQPETGGSTNEIATTSKSETRHDMEEQTSMISATTSHRTQDNTVTALERAEESVKMALSRAEETISTEAMRAATALHAQEKIEESSSQRIISENDERFEKTVSTAGRVQRFSEGIHERVRREVSTLRDGPEHGQAAAVRRGRSTSDLPVRKAPTKMDSWESNLRKSTVASSGKVTRNATISGGETKKTQSYIPRSTRKSVTVTAHSEPHQKSASVPEGTKKRPPLKKAKSLTDDSSEEAKKRVKKMPSQGSTRKTAISVESAVEAAGETVVKRALEKAKSTPDSAEDTSSETSKSTSLSTSWSTRHRRERHSSSSEETRESPHVVQTELVHAAATIQDAFRDLREHKVPVDENGREMQVPPRTSFQIEPVLEEIAEEVGGERRGSRQESQGADNEDTSTSESSLSSAATRIQAGFRGHLARRHRLHRHGTGGTTSMGTASTSVSMSMSRDSDAGVVRAMSLLEDSEVQRHQLEQSPLDQLPEADDQEYGPAKYVADVHRAQAEARDGKKGVEWARSLDSGLSSGPERHTPVRTAMSVQQRVLGGRDLDEHIWRTLEHDMLAGEAATDDSEDTPRREGPRRMSTRRGLHRGNAMQLPTTSSSTPPSLEEPQQAAAEASARHTGEFHDMLVLPLHTGLPSGPSDQPAAPQHQSGTSRAGFSLNGHAEDASPRQAAQQEAPAKAPAEPQAAGVATAAAPPPPARYEYDDMKAAEAAATTIQAGFRGYKVRRQLREQSQDHSAKEADPAIGDGPGNGSVSARGDQPQPPPPGQQCRGGSGGGSRHHRGSMEAEAALEAALDEELMQRSAARIQAGVRGFLVRRRQHNASMAAAKIQAGFRGYRTRRELKQRDHRLRDLRDHRGGGKVQMPVRQAAQ